MTGSRAVFVLAACAWLAACERRDQLAAPDTAASKPTPAQQERIAYISISDLAPRVGDTIIVAGTLGVGKAISLGSFRVRLEYDTSRLAFLAEVPLPGMLRVTNPKNDAVIVTGASSEPSSTGELFALRFIVRDATGIESLFLKIDELNDAGFASTMESVTKASRLVLDTALIRRKGQTR